MVSVALYDTLGATAKETIIDECELTTIFCSGDLVDSLIELKKAGKVPTL